MKKFLKEFKDFAIKGNFLDMAVAVVLGGAFSKVVNAVVEIFLNPIIENIKIANVQAVKNGFSIVFESNGKTVNVRGRKGIQEIKRMLSDKEGREM